MPETWVSVVQIPPYQTHTDGVYLVLTDDEIAAIEKAGAKGPRGLTAQTLMKRVSLLALGGVVSFGLYSYIGMNTFFCHMS